MKHDQPATVSKELLRLAKQARCRVPALAVNTPPAESRAALPEMIRYAAPEFYQQINELGPTDWDALQGKLRMVLWKYQNRAMYRATPFGRFASVSLVKLKNTHTSEPLVLKQLPVIHQLPDWTEAMETVPAATLLFKDAHWLVANPTVYRCGETCRYVAEGNDHFVMSGVDADEMLLGVLAYCRQPAHKHQVSEFLCTQYGVTSRQAKNYLSHLVTNQLLLTDRHPNITGEDYFKRMGTTQSATRQYLIAEREVAGGYLSEADFRQLREAVHLLHRGLPRYSQPDLDAFKSRFLQKFEYRTIPLLEALDPEIGVGYGSLEQEASSDGLTDVLVQAEQADAGFPLDDIHRCILNLVVQGLPVRLEELELPTKDHGLRLPNTFNGLVRLADGLVIVEQLGGATATALLGRFSIAMGSVGDLARHLALVESESNPGVLFFDVAYRGDRQADNINRRAHLYEYELPVLTWSTHPQPLRLDDLQVSIVDGEVLLSSRSLGKRVVPRMATAYNTRRSDLPIFRFLSDLQHQGLRTDLSIRLPTVLPGLSYYPRIQYKQVVLSPARWRIPGKFLAQKPATVSLANELAQWLADKGVGKWCRCGQADQLLYVDTEKPDELLMLLAYMQQVSEAYIEEALIPNRHSVMDEFGNSYRSEFVLSFIHTEQLYQPYTPPADALQGQFTKKNLLFLPGDEWIYVTVYLHPGRSTDFLVSVAKPFVASQRKVWADWFFVRYADPDPHLRLRFRLKADTDFAPFMREFAACLEPYLQSGIIQDMAWKPYRPEAERYGTAMRQVEAYFTKSSELVLAMLAKTGEMGWLYASAISLLMETVGWLGWDVTQQAQFATRMADHFSAEFEIGPSEFKAINKRFREWREQPWELPPSLAQKTKHTAKAFATALAAGPAEMRRRLVADLFHMHVNRLFNQRQRIHEGVIYQFLAMLLKAKKATGK